MSTLYPIPRQTRQAILTAGGGQTVFGPFDFILFDDVDLQVRTRPTAADEWTLLNESGWTAAPASPAIGWPALFTLTLDSGLAAGTQIWVKGVRLHERQTNVTLGSAIRSTLIERELDRESAVLQELRRDQEDISRRTLQVPWGETVDPLPASSARGRGLNVLGFAPGTGAPMLLGPDIFQVIKIDDAVEYASVPALALAIVPTEVAVLRTLGYHTPGDGGGCLRRRVEGPGPGRVPSADGAYWEVAETAPSVKTSGAVGDVATPDQVAIGDALATGSLVVSVPAGTYLAKSPLDISYVYGQHLKGEACAWADWGNSRIHFDYAGGSGLKVTRAGTVLENLHISGVSRAAGPGKLIDADFGGGIQPDIDVVLKGNHIGPASTLLYVNGRGGFLENCLINNADVCLDVDYPASSGTPTEWGNTPSGGARKYVARNNYVHQGAGKFVRNAGGRKDKVHGIHVTNNYCDNGGAGFGLFSGDLNCGTLALNQVYRQAGEVITLTGGRGLAHIHGNLVYGAPTSEPDSGFSPPVARSLINITGPCETVVIENNCLMMNNRPAIAVGDNVETLIIRGLYGRKLLLGNAAGRTDSVIEIASGVTVGHLLIDDVVLDLDNMAGNASAYILKNLGTIGRLTWGNVAVNNAAGLGKIYGAAGKGMAVLLARSANATLANTTLTTLDWDAETYDDAAFHDPSTNPSRITVPQGVSRVRLQANIEFAWHATGDRRVQILKNNNVIAGYGVSRAAAAASSAVVVQAASADLPAEADDYFTVRVYQSSGGDLNVVAGGSTWFSMTVLQ